MGLVCPEVFAKLGVVDLVRIEDLEQTLLGKILALLLELLEVLHLYLKLLRLGL